MRVLLVAIDLFKAVGGGQTVYRKIVTSTPDVDFYYFRFGESDSDWRPRNAHAVPLQAKRSVRLHSPPLQVPSYVTAALADADEIARSVAGLTFDVIDLPDYYAFGSVFRSALVHHEVKFGRLVVAGHGNASTSLMHQWGSSGDRLLWLRDLERAQFESADACYFISKRYMREWQQLVDRDSYYIDPAYFLEATPAVDWAEGNMSPPSLYCVGRSERIKGNDLFVELIRWLRPHSYARAIHIGPEVRLVDGTTSGTMLREMATRRSIHLESLGQYDRAAMLRIYAAQTLVVLPARYETLSLAALESLASGCPTVISDRAGVCEYLDETHPGIPYIKLDLDHFYDSIPAVQDVVDKYSSARSMLRGALEASPLRAFGTLDMAAVYDDVLAKPPRLQRSVYGLDSLSSGDACQSHRTFVSTLGAVLPRSNSAIALHYDDRWSAKRHILNIARPWVPEGLKEIIRPVLANPRAYVIGQLKNSPVLGDARYAAALIDGLRVTGRLKSAEGRSRHSEKALRDELTHLYQLASSPLYRCNFWLDIATIERLRGNDIVAAAYELRLLRLMGRDRLGILDRLVRTLSACGFPEEAQAASLQYGPYGAQAVEDYLRDRELSLRQYRPKAYQHHDDRRQGQPKVAVIVSLYKAAKKLETFLAAIKQQTLAKKGEVEIILIDSGSPDGERWVFEKIAARDPLNIVYGRTAERESIQAAWNRGINLSRAPYLVFLGVDETLYPEGLETLAAELDTDRNIDWVMSNSLVTTVDNDGLHRADIMRYDRGRAHKDLTYLDTTYLSWVGGMYRRTIHDRFGYYDESFRGAGDTEFKNRVLHRIAVKYLNRTLGLFWNYPEGQTTASPLAEIEDSRAWYLHRSPGGIRIAFGQRDVAEVENLLCSALGYRKCYLSYESTDIEYASLLAAFALSESELARKLKPGLDQLLSALVSLEFTVEEPSRISPSSHLIGVHKRVLRWSEIHKGVLNSAGRCGTPRYEIFNDNRFEQHAWLWKTVED